MMRTMLAVMAELVVASKWPMRVVAAAALLALSVWSIVEPAVTR